MDPSTMLAISALGALAQGGGAAIGGYYQGQAADRDYALKKKQMLIEQQNRAQDRATSAGQYADSLATQRRGEITNAPANSISMLSGLANLRKGWGQPNNMDVLSLLAGG
jgi:hypothetical protein